MPGVYRFATKAASQKACNTKMISALAQMWLCARAMSRKTMFVFDLASCLFNKTGFAESFRLGRCVECKWIYKYWYCSCLVRVLESTSA